MGLVPVLFVLLGVCASSAGAWELPEGRSYEMVSPPYKADYGVAQTLDSLGAAPNGESVVFTSLGAFAGAQANVLTIPYIARRTSSGWQTSATNPPPADGRLPNAIDYSSDLSHQLALADAEKAGALFSQGTAAIVTSDLEAPESPFTQVWPIPNGPATFPGEPEEPGEYAGASANLTHAIFRDSFGGLHQIVGLGGPDPKEEPVAVVGQPDGPGNSILQPCPGLAQKRIIELPAGSHVISESGMEIFFERFCGGLFVRVNGSTTLELAPNGAFDGASRSGAIALFGNEAGELMMDEIDSIPGQESISRSITLSPGSQARVIVTSEDGSHVYFTSPGIFAGPNAQGISPTLGASNLYVYDAASTDTTFVATATVNVGRERGIPEAQTTPDGRYLAFTTDAPLTADDTDSTASIYRYDSQTGELLRVSVGEGGQDNNGNDNSFGATIASPVYGPKAIDTWHLNTRAITDDGSTIVFSTAAPLSTRAVNGNVNIYVWHEGSVGMISTGLSSTADEFPIISPTGRDIFFLSRQNILPQDSDGLADIYDARIGGGFPQASVSVGGCSGETCQGPPAAPTLLGAPASATFSGLGNSAPAPAGVTVTTKARKIQCKRGYRKRSRKGCVKTKTGTSKGRRTRSKLRSSKEKKS